MSDPGDTTPRQELLFTDGLDPVPDELIGYRGPTACHAAGITYRQLDYWARTGLVGPVVRSAAGSGTQRLYSFSDILVLKVVKRLLDTGVSLQNIRVAVEHLRDRGVDDLARITLMSDGTTVYECTSAEEVVDLLAGRPGRLRHRGQRGAQELDGSLATLPSERAEPGTDAAEAAPGESDELGRGAGAGLRPLSLKSTRRQSAEASSRPVGIALAYAAGREPGRRGAGAGGRPLVAWSALQTPCGRVPGKPAGAPKGQPPRNLSGAQDRAGEATLDGSGQRGSCRRAVRRRPGCPPDRPGAPASTASQPQDRRMPTVRLSPSSSPASRSPRATSAPAAEDQAADARRGRATARSTELVAAAVPGSIADTAPLRPAAGRRRGRGAGRAARAGRPQRDRRPA